MRNRAISTLKRSAAGWHGHLARGWLRQSKVGRSATASYRHCQAARVTPLHVRRLRCEPLEDRRLLSLSDLTMGSLGALIAA